MASQLIALFLATGAPCPVQAFIKETGIQNKYYQDYNYTGSRVLEHGVDGRFMNYTQVTWTQQAAQDIHGRVWSVDRYKHVIIMMEPFTRYIEWPSLYNIYAGQEGRHGYYDGSRARTLFHSPMGIAVREERGVTIIYIADTSNHCVRTINTKTGRASTLAGNPNDPGHLDGDGTYARLRYPLSIGVDDRAVYIVDNESWLRRIDENKMITTLANGACREERRFNMVATIVVRIVGCHLDWLVKDTAEQVVETFQWEAKCKGHQITCGRRNNPILADRYSQHLNHPDYLQQEVQVNTDGGLVDPRESSTVVLDTGSTPAE